MISFDAYVDQMCAYSIDEQSNAYLIHEYLFPVRIRQGKQIRKSFGQKRAGKVFKNIERSKLHQKDKEKL